MHKNIVERFTQKYYDDINGIIDYIAEKNKNSKAALDLLDKFEDAIKKRTPIADSFKSFNTSRDRNYPYYKINVANYYIFYVIINEKNKDIEEYRRVLNNKMNWNQII